MGFMTGHTVHMGQMRNAYNILVRKPQGKKTFVRPGYRWIILKRILGK
jgi:hypothetical protein